MARLVRVTAGVIAVVALVGCAKSRQVLEPPSPTGLPPMTRVESLTGAHFAFDKAGLTPEGREKLRSAASVLNQYPSRNVQVNGYTDSVGSDAYNQRLSQERADAVREALVADGVTASRLTARGFGEASPISSNTTAEGRAENRRVELILE